MKYTIFISHGWHDKWIAKQMARLVAEAGATPFIDIFDIKIGDRIEEKVRRGILECSELVALLTPWSVDRNWVWTEIAAAWALEKRYAGVTYGVNIEDIEKIMAGWLASLPQTSLLWTTSRTTYAKMSERAQSEACT